MLSGKHRVCLPRTQFPVKVKPAERAAVDRELAERGGIDNFYHLQAQREWSVRSFTLLDGPPYANGPAHVGHAINKVLKDFIVKSRALLGCRVHYRPGWDCHGLPIELKIRRAENEELNALEVRRRSRELALSSSKAQMSAFKRWGVSADWSQPYMTLDPGYVSKQLSFFADLYEKGLVYRDYKPVYWSPSSHTALAEAELDYVEGHESTAVHFEFQIVNWPVKSVRIRGGSNRQPSCLVWTTTPWTLPFNNAVAFNPESPYSLIEIQGFDKKVFLVAQEAIPGICEETKREVTLLTTFNASSLQDVHYRCTTHNELARPLIPAAFVDGSRGTGLVHLSYAHGFDDYQVAVARGDKVECFVDDHGRYTRDTGYALEGRDVLAEGAAAVCELFKKHVVHMSRYRHSYPYDWRTRKPVITKASLQWFIDVSDLVPMCAEIVCDGRLRVGVGDPDKSDALMAELGKRPQWCISRQRVWGVPIPTLVDVDSGQAFTSGEFIRYIARLVNRDTASLASTDIWWSASLEELAADKDCPASMREMIRSKSCRLSKGTDIMDVWLDSGFAWHTLAHEPQTDPSSALVADVVVEGVDQFRGWFQSSLLTSTGLQGCSPFRQILAHGFAVDEDGNKMSKSLGNVVDPDVITDGPAGVGADGLRLWVAMHAAETSGKVHIGKAVMEEIGGKIVDIRTLLRFLLGALDGYQGDTENRRQLQLLDKHILMEVRDFLHRTKRHYEEYRFRVVANQLIQFLHNPISSLYVFCVRDRLYCDRPDSPSRLAACWTLDQIGSAIATVIFPLMPHLATEFRQHRQPNDKPAWWCLADGAAEKELDEAIGDEGTTREVMRLLLRLRSEMNSLKLYNKGKITETALQISLPRDDISLLTGKTAGAELVDEELLEVLGFPYARLADGEQLDVKTIPLPEERLHCPRCRRMSRLRAQDEYCRRCLDALSC